MQTIGEFYRDKILSQKKLRKVEFPKDRGKNRIEQDLFGWKLFVSNNVITCQSEEEARYLKLFLEIGMYEVKVPKDEAYLKRILPELEELKSKIDTIIDEHLSRIFSRKIRKQIRASVWAEIRE